ncbi:MAG: protoglobin domain-containing protein [Phycisphaerales bacterium]
MLRIAIAVSALSVPACVGAGERSLGQEHQPEIPGYTLGASHVPAAPITLGELGLIQQSLLMGEEDVKYLRMSRDVLEPHVEELVGVWYGFVGSNPHLLASFSSASGEVDSAYLERVRARFERWVLDTAEAKYNQDWLDYQFEIGRRHHRVGKNKTDNARAVDQVQFRYIQALTVPVTTTIRPFLERGGHSQEEVDKMHAAWVKSVTLQAILWSYPYVNEGDF